MNFAINNTKAESNVRSVDQSANWNGPRCEFLNGWPSNPENTTELDRWHLTNCCRSIAGSVRFPRQGYEWYCSFKWTKDLSGEISCLQTLGVQRERVWPMATDGGTSQSRCCRRLNTSNHTETAKSLFVFENRWSTCESGHLTKWRQGDSKCPAWHWDGTIDRPDPLR
jgi:hypothetical protein